VTPIISSYQRKITKREGINRTAGLTASPAVCLGHTFMLLITFLFIVLSSGCEVSTGDNLTSNSGTEWSGSSSVLERLSGYTIPSEISAVPAGDDTSSPQDVSSDTQLSAAAAGTDYANAKTAVYVEENVLKQFEQLKNILEAIDQTNYEEEIGNGPYKAMVAMMEESDGREQKMLQTWVVQSDAAKEDGENYLRVRAWIATQYEQDAPMIKAEIKVYTPPTRNADGSYQDYGKWEMHVKMDATREEHCYVASCDIGDNGFAVIKLYEKNPEEDPSTGEDLPTKVKAIMVRSGTQGYGKIYFPDYDDFYCPDCDQSSGIPHKTAVYAYNKNHLAIREGEEVAGSIVYGDPVFRDRNSKVKMTRRYGIFNALTGEDVLKSKSFGFPVQYEENSFARHAYYGSWQGRHEIWTSDGSIIPEGTTVEREDIPQDQTAETYSAGKTYYGVLSQRTYVDAVPGDIKGIAIEIWMDQDYNLNYNTGDGSWYFCTQMDWASTPPVCAGTAYDFDSTVGLDTLIVEENNSLKKVFISGWDSFAGTDKTFVYEPAKLVNGFQAGFYEAAETITDFGPVFRATLPRTLLDTGYIQQLWVRIEGSIFVEYLGAGAGWVEKEVTYFDEITWTPVFNASGDKSFSFPEGKSCMSTCRASATS